MSVQRAQPSQQAGRRRRRPTAAAHHRPSRRLRSRSRRDRRPGPACLPGVAMGL